LHEALHLVYLAFADIVFSADALSIDVSSPMKGGRGYASVPYQSRVSRWLQAEASG
jgi:hypothetical protein